MGSCSAPSACHGAFRDGRNRHSHTRRIQGHILRSRRARILRNRIHRSRDVRTHHSCGDHNLQVRIHHIREAHTRRSHIRRAFRDHSRHSRHIRSQVHSCIRNCCGNRDHSHHGRHDRTWSVSLNAFCDPSPSFHSSWKIHGRACPHALFRARRDRRESTRVASTHLRRRNQLEHVVHM